SYISGYNLSKLLTENNKLKMPYLLAGSEGTLGIITKARLKITKINPYKALIVTYYDDFLSAVRDGKNLLQFQPYAIETMDEKIIELAKNQPSLPSFIQKLIKDIKNINISEFQSQTKQDLEKQIENFLSNYSQKTLSKNAQSF